VKRQGKPLGAKQRFIGVSVYCSCGAQWHGVFTDNNPIIPIHEQRDGLISEDQFRRAGHTIKKPAAWEKAH